MNKDFIKRVAVFGVSFLSFFAIICIAVAAVAFVRLKPETKTDGNTGDKTVTEKTESISEVTAESQSFSLAVMCDSGNFHNICCLTYNADNGTVDCVGIPDTEININGVQMSIGDLYEKRTEDEFLSACSKTAQKSIKKYLIFNKKSFVKIADRFGGILYNKNDNEPVILSGISATDHLSEDGFFESAVLYLVNSFVGHSSGNGVTSDFLFLYSNCTTNLSYPDFYDNKELFGITE